MMRVIVVGAGGHGQVVMDILQGMVRSGKAVQPAGYLDDDPSLWGQSFLGALVLGGVAESAQLPEAHLVIAIGNNAKRRELGERLLSEGRHLFTAVHPSAVIAPSAMIEAGTMVCAGAVVNPAAHIGRSVILNTSCTVDHHTAIGDCAHVAPGARLGGAVEVGVETLVGIGAVVLPGVKVGARAVVGGGAVVLAEVGDEAVVAGNPARALSRRESK
jgi:sugar O-acyltransferase (sialic acid O-acetyltransferase NeuD family)